MDHELHFLFSLQFLYVNQNCDLKTLSPSHDRYPFWELNKCFLSTTDRRQVWLASCYFECFKGALVVAVLLLVLVGAGGADLYCRQEQQTHGDVPWYEGLGTTSAQRRCKSPLSFGSVTLYKVHETRDALLLAWADEMLPCCEWGEACLAKNCLQQWLPSMPTGQGQGVCLKVDAS